MSEHAKPPRWSRLYARFCPEFTCPVSRHVKVIAQQILRAKRSPVRRWMIAEGYDPDHWAASLEATVIALWKARAENARLRGEGG